jgi:hypothetical protein
MKTESAKTRKNPLFDKILPELTGTSVSLRLSIPRSFHNSLKKFIKDYSLHPKFDVRKILEYGLTEESDEELKKLEKERMQPFSEVHTKYAVTKFKAYENLMENKVLALRLQFLVSENERLRQAMFKKGLIDSPETGWTRKRIEEFQNKYVFNEKVTNG